MQLVQSLSRSPPAHTIELARNPLEAGDEFLTSCPCLLPTSASMTDVAALLPYQRTLLSELVPTPENPRPLDALLILARGLGLRAIIANLVRRTLEGSD